MKGTVRINIHSPLNSGSGVVFMPSPCLQDTGWSVGVGICALILLLFSSSSAHPFLHSIWRAPLAKVLLPIAVIPGQFSLSPFKSCYVPLAQESKS